MKRILLLAVIACPLGLGGWWLMQARTSAESRVPLRIENVRFEHPDPDRANPPNSVSPNADPQTANPQNANPQNANPQIGRFEKLELRFQLSRVFARPFDPAVVDVFIEVTTPEGQRQTHPAFYDEGFRLQLIAGKEVPRRVESPSWRVRYTPRAVGRYQWTLVAVAGDDQAKSRGTFTCVPGEGRGFVRVSTDPRYFEFDNGDLFYPIGHTCRSLVDRRWAQFAVGVEEQVREYDNRGVACYDDWFAKMAANGENFATVWMSPWWCGLEWSPTMPGYRGLGHYNQIHAAQLDRIVAAAERHGIYLLLYTMNHGALSSVTDSQWHLNPLNERQPGGYLTHAADFFSSQKAQQSHRDQLRYIVARWGYSPAIAVWGITTETDWMEAYYGERSLTPDKRKPFRGFAPGAFDIPRRRESVRRWLVKSASYLKRTDAHQHLVSTQFSSPTEGDQIWLEPDMEVVLSSAYTGVATKRWQADEYHGSHGVADALYVLGKRCERFPDRPAMIAEWGGATEWNSETHLTAELHTGIWVTSMTTTAGVTGFWWWNLIDTRDGYKHFRAVARYVEGEERRGQDYRSARARVLVRFPGAGRVDLPSSRAQAITLANDRALFGYVYCHEINRPTHSRAATTFDDPSFGRTVGAELELPDHLVAGQYEVEFWDTFAGRIIERRRIRLEETTARRLPLIPFGVDLAVKVRCVSRRLSSTTAATPADEAPTRAPSSPSKTAS